jgi:cell division protein FtsB
MPTARSAATTAASRQLRARQPINRPRPKGLQVARTLAGLRWDRLGRISLLVVLLVVSLIGVQRVLSYLSARAQAARVQTTVQQLARQNAKLEAQQRALSEPATLAADARKLGMVRIGEHPYVVTSNH